MRDDDALDLANGGTGKSVIDAGGDWLEPELGALASGFHMDVRRLSPFIAVEEEAIGTDPQHCGHPPLPFIPCGIRLPHAITPPAPTWAASAEPRPLGRRGQLRRDRGYLQRRSERRRQGRRDHSAAEGAAPARV